MKSNSTVAICVATKDRPELLRSCLTSIMGQDIPANVHLRHICVVDNSNSGSARELVGRLAHSRSDVDVQYRHAPGGGYSSVRNALLDMVPTASDFFVFLDDDEVVEPEWLGRIVNYAVQEQLHLVAGPVEAIPPIGTAPPWFVRRGHLRPKAVPDRDSVLPTGNLLVSANEWRQVGLRFDPVFDATGGEDIDWTLGMLERGLRSGYCAEAKAKEVWSQERFHKAYWRRRAFRSGRSHWLRIAKRDPDSGKATLLAVAIGREALPRIASGLFRFLHALITNNHEGRWLAQARVMRGVGMLFQAVRDMRVTGLRTKK